MDTDVSQKFYKLAAKAIALVDMAAEAAESRPGLFIGQQAPGLIHAHELRFVELADSTAHFSQEKTYQEGGYGPYEGTRRTLTDRLSLDFDRLAELTEVAIAEGRRVPFAHVRALLAIAARPL